MKKIVLLISFILLSYNANSQIVIDRIQEEVDKCNEQFGKWERIKRFELTPEVWSIDSGHLTPTMKMKRKIILEIYNIIKVLI